MSDPRIKRVSDEAIAQATRTHVEPACHEALAALGLLGGEPVDPVTGMLRLQELMVSVLHAGMEVAATELQATLAEAGIRVGLWFEDGSARVDPDLN